jgi:hypothetical protein
MPEKLLLDRRAGLLVRVGEEAGADDDLLSTDELAEWLAVSTQWCEIGRHRGYGPPYLKLAGRVRYRRSDVLTWLNERTHRGTSEYPTRGPRRSRPAQDTAVSEPAPRFVRRAP